MFSGSLGESQFTNFGSRVKLDPAQVLASHSWQQQGDCLVSCPVEKVRDVWFAGQGQIGSRDLDAIVEAILTQLLTESHRCSFICRSGRAASAQFAAQGCLGVGCR